jgi:hypothetical protein
LHVAALLDSSVEHQRIHAWSDAFVWNDILAILRQNQPDKKFVDNVPEEGKMMTTVDDKLTRELLKKWGDGQNAPLDLERGIKDTINGKQPAAGDGKFLW